MRRGYAALALGLLVCGAVRAASAQTPAVKFKPRTDVVVPGETPFDLVAADLNKDQKSDIAVANMDSGDIAVLLGKGDGSFETGVTYGAGDFPTAIAAGKVTNDDNVDLAVANDGSSNVSLFIGSATGTFTGPTNTDTALSPPEAVVLADFNGDTKLDLATAELFDDTVTVRLGNRNATGTFGDARSVNVAGGPFGMAAGDFDGDTKLDLVVSANDVNRVVILHGNGDGTFVAPDCALVPTPAGCLTVGGVDSAPAGVTVGDLNGDQKLDIVSANNASDDISVLINNGDGTFAAALNLGTGFTSFPESVRIADFNGDGKADIVAVNNETANIAIFTGHGDGTFDTAVFFALPDLSSPLAVEVTDLNGDGQPDVVTVNADAASMSVLLNDSAVQCTGDCDGSDSVTVEELVRGVNIALGTAPLSDCPSFDKNDSGDVTVEELIIGVNNALGECSA
ncbi:MAG: VCBS repeat-containing protein [Deltaproteobacteria bacterium]|nr:VCBS repeat-containing protein [Deltaproteobacteria bacterium]MBI3389048.1 VCBS repeat-containing protein [Deltaproteobacteria bacterium]